MKTKKLLSVLFACFITGSILAQTSGGPDAFGYTWKNDAAVGGPVYTWNDIKATGTQITGLGDDNSTGPYNIGWSFRFYWSDYTNIKVGSNGWLGFTGSSNNIAANFPPLPSPTAKNTICPLMADLTFTQSPSGAVPGATAWYWTNNTDMFIVQYDSVPYWVAGNPGYSGRYTFQVILSGADSSITFQYKVAQEGTIPYNTGEGLRTGIVNSTGQIGLLVLNDVFPTAQTAVKFYYPNPVTYQVFDATPAWNQNPENGGFFVSANGSPVNLTTDVANAGNQPISSITVTGRLLAAGLTQVWTSSSTVTSLAAGADSMLTYPATYSASTPGGFIYRSTTSGSVPADINPVNDVTNVEMVVVDTTTANIALSYVTATPTGQNAWGGNGGQGIYIEPPFYPAAISSLDFFVMGSDVVGYHLVQIVDNDGPGNSPGTVLYLDSVAASVAVPGQYNNVPLDTPLVITSGGVYVAWFENNDAMSAIGTDNGGVGILLSNRNYEIIGGSWANYRGNDADDIMIQVNTYKFGIITTSTTADNCPSNSSGSATVSVSGGMTPFTYLWTPGGQTTATATGLAAGNYSVDISDANGAMTTAVVLVSNAAVSISSSTNVTCYGGNDGTATAAIGGTAPYTYMWTPSGQTTQTATGLSVGTYSVTAINADGCLNMATVTLTSPAMISIIATSAPSGCAGGTGSATAAVSGGTGPYTYMWSTTPSQTTATATGLNSGNYTISITDAVGCTSSATVPVMTIPFNISSSTTAINCFNGSNGTATATAASGGTAPYTYAWSTSPIQTSQTATGLSAGSYTVAVTDALGCTAITTVTLANPTAVIPTAVSTACTTCPATPNGTATGSATGGTGPYTYLWSPGGQTTANITGLSPDTYTVCITDSKGCTNCVSVTVADNTGVNEIYSGASIVISPNPFNASASVKIDFVNTNHSQLTFVVYDIYGREIQSVDLSAMKGATIDFTLNRGYNIPDGLYFYRLKDNESILSAGKLIVQ